MPMITKAMTLILLITLVLLSPQPVLAAVKDIDAPTLKAMMEARKITVFFPLSRIEFNDLHIPGSHQISIEDIPAKLPADRNQHLAFYCLGRS
jgi:hypothetical protein